MLGVALAFDNIPTPLPNTVARIPGYHNHLILHASDTETVWDITLPYKNYISNSFLTLILCPYTLVGPPDSSTNISVKVYGAVTDPLFGPIDIQSDRETTVKSETRVLSGALKGLDMIGNSLSRVPIIGGIASTISRFANPMAAFFERHGLQKPTDISAPTVTTISTSENTSLSRGLFSGYKFSIDQETKMSTDPTLYPDPQISDSSLLLLSQVPGLVHLAAAPNATTATTLPGPAPTGLFYGTTDKTETFFRLVSRHANYYSGSTKYQLHFVTSPFTSARFVIYMVRGTSTDIDWAAHPHKIVDVTGHTVVNFTVPYMGYAPMQRTTDASPYTVRVLAINPPVASNTAYSTAVNLVCFAAAGEDVEYSGEQHTPVYPQSSLTKVFATTFDPLVPAVAVKQSPTGTSERLSHINDVLLRPRGPVIWDNVASQDFWPKPTIDITKVFQFSRCSYRVTLGRYNNPAIDANATYFFSSFDGSYSNNGVIPWTPAISPTISFELLRFSPDYFDTSPSQIYLREYADVYSSPAIFWALVSYGDDTTFSSRIPPPNYT